LSDDIFTQGGHQVTGKDMTV